MYLKSIEVQGFKSFANKMKFEFHEGITAIVGPNGSGKSNVADAVRWVLGEQSAKQLRGSKMEDVIFSGTETRKPLGFAYVAITLDNSDHKLAVEYDEVTVARRVYRSGESEYLLNGSNCRLKDVQELFFDTGIGKEGYSIIGQGQIEKILSGKPEERRELFDEAAGIVKFKKRKQAAEKNLEAEKQNLCRVHDILTELEKQIGPLKQQEETARAYLKLKEQLKACEVNMYLQDYAKIRTELKETGEKAEIVAGDLAATGEKYDAIKVEYEKLEQQLEAYGAQIEEKRGKAHEERLNQEKLEGEIKVLNEQILSATAGLKTSKERLGEIDGQIKERKAALEKQMADKQAVDREIDSLDDAQTKADAELQSMHAEVESIRAAIEEKNGDIIEFLNEAAAVKAKIGRYDTMIEQINIRKSELNQRLIVLKSEEDSKNLSVKAYEDELALKMEAICSSQKQQADFVKMSEEISGKLAGLHRAVDDKQQAYHRAHSKYAALKNISERYDGYGSSIRKVMEKKAENAGIIGVVADIVKVEKKYETAIEIALGGSIQNVVTDNEKTAKQLIAYLKQNRLGRATFLPLTSVSGKAGQVSEAVLKEKGVIGAAAGLVSCEERFHGLIRYLLGRIVVADTIDNALALAKKYHYTLRIVTLEGESLNPGGSLSGGAYKNSSNLLGRNREIEALQKQIETIKASIDSLNKQLSESQTEKARLKKALEAVNTRLQELSLEENTIRMSLNQAKQAAKNSADVYAELSCEENELKRQIAEINSSKTHLTDVLKDCGLKQEETKANIQSLTEALEAALEKEKAFTEKTSGLRLEAGSYLQKNQFIVENIKRIKGEIARLNEDREKLEGVSIAQEAEVSEKKAAIRAYEDRTQALIQSISSADATLKALIEKQNEISAGHKSFFSEREALADRMSVLDKENFRLSNQLEKLEEAKTAQSNYMWEEYELTYNSAQQLKDDTLQALGQAALKKNISGLKASIKALGNVNVNAIEEYKEISERYALLKTQHDDLIEAEEKLAGIIESLDRAMREQFAEKFAQIQKNFDRVFKELFGGGRGALELMEDEDILYAGIRIIASPPGKKLQNMMQMSGGEKALTAIALLFAIQSLKPSPFCLLDEIEAALDDANVKRYAQYLHKLTKDTQFIVITHRRGTMNAADILYGITMQEKGVSTLVSVNLIDSKLDD